MKITIEGDLKSGKSTLAQLIKETLQAHGIEVQVEDEPLTMGWYTKNTQRLEKIADDGMPVVIKTLTNKALNG